MSTTLAPRNLIFSSELTLATLCISISEDAALEHRRRQDVCSALRTLAKAIDLPLAEIPAHPGFIRDRVKGLTAAMGGLSPARWQNVLSLVRSALTYAGLINIPGRYQKPLGSEWANLATALPSKRLRFGLSRIVSYCSERGIAPDAVCDKVLEAFLRDLEESGSVKNPRRTHRMACGL